MAKAGKLLEQTAYPDNMCLCPKCMNCLLDVGQIDAWEDAVFENSDTTIRIIECHHCGKKIRVNLEER